MPIFLANDSYEGFLQTTYNPGESVFALDNVPLNVPTIVVSAPGTIYEAVFTVTGKTINALTGVTRIRGYNGVLVEGTAITCLNNEEFINQYRTYLGMSWRGEYDAGTDYAIQDAVTYLGSSYIAIAPTTGNLPTDTDFWQLVTSKGDTGATIESAAFVADDLVFTKDDATTVTVVNAKVDLKGAPGNDGADGLGVPAGGATGEVLKKKSNTDNDTEWGNLVAVSVTTKGDLQTHDSDSPERLGVGNNDEVLMADSSTATGIKWAKASAVSNVRGEVPSGLVNSSNTAYTLANTPLTGSLRVYQNGIRLKITEDYTLAGTTLTFGTAPATGDLILVDYEINSGQFATGSCSFVDNEIPSGLVNSSNTTYTLVSTPITGSLKLFRDGQLMTGGGADYTLTGNSIVFVTAPASGSVLLAFYQSLASTAGNADTLDGYHANSTPTANNIPVLDASAKLPISILSGAWTAWTPVFTNVTVGSGSVGGRYCQIGKTIIGEAFFVFGAGSAVGQAELILPISISANYASFTPIGLVTYDDSGILYNGRIFNTNGYLSIDTVSGTRIVHNNVGATAPFTWAAGDRIKVSFTYEAA